MVSNPTTFNRDNDDYCMNAGASPKYGTVHRPTVKHWYHNESNTQSRSVVYPELSNDSRHDNQRRYDNRDRNHAHLGIIRVINDGRHDSRRYDHHDNYNRSSPSKEFTPPVPSGRRGLRTEENCPSSNNSHMEKEKSRKHDTSNESEAESYNDAQMTKSSSEQDEENQSSPSPENRSRRSHSPETIKSPVNPQNLSKSPSYSPKSLRSPVNTSSTGKILPQLFYLFSGIVIILSILVFVYIRSSSTAQTQSISHPISQSNTISESLESIKETFYNQESDIWNDISSAINEVISRTPKKPSIILLFANESNTMDCLATKLANVCKTILYANDYREFNPKDFGDDAGVIITTLNKYPSEEKKVVMIRDILNINAEGIKALHNLCDRENPLIPEAIFILTMQTTSYKSPQKKLDFVEKQINNKLLKSIDQDVLMALVTRITDGAIISVQSQPDTQLRYC